MATTNISKQLFVNGINMQILESGKETQTVILFLHGFPDFSYTWRHQIQSLSSRFRCIAPDLRGFGGSRAGSSSSGVDARDYTANHIVGDLIALLDHLGIGKVIVVAHDLGAMIAGWLCLFRPDRVTGLLCVGALIAPRDSDFSPLKSLMEVLGPNHYICRFQENGIFDEFRRVGVRNILLMFLTSRSPSAPIIPDGFDAIANARQLECPSWLTEDDLQHYIDTFSASGFDAGITYFRALDRTWELTEPWTGLHVSAPVSFIFGDLDITYNRYKSYINGSALREDLPNVKQVFVIPDAAHYVHQEYPNIVTNHIQSFVTCLGLSE